MQTSNATYFNRYPFLWNQIKDEEVHNILSFGCSTGEEAVTAKAYFPNASVVGTDINKPILNIARLRFGNHITFIYSLNDVPRETYDLILCNSVLCNHPQNSKETENKIMTFEYFASEIKKLDALLNKNGILMAMNTEYRVSDVLDYEPIGIKVNHQVAVFDKFGYKTTHKQFALWRKA